MRQAGYGKGQRKGRWVIPPEGVGLVVEDRKGSGMAGQRKKQGGLGIFGGSGEGMYYGVFGLAARCERLKPSPNMVNTAYTP